MTERTPWWRAFLGPKKKTGNHKDTGSSPFSPDFNPFEQDKQKNPSATASKTSGDQPPSQHNKPSNLLSDDTFDDSQMDSVFNEQTCRRNMKVSRSGRFKEKKKVRSSLPIQEKEPETVASGKEDIRWQ